MLSVLILSPDPAVPGGVSTFVETAKRHLRDSRATAFWVGSTGGRTGWRQWPATFCRLLAAPVQIAWRARRHRIDVIHINPSFDTKALIRDALILLALRVAGFGRIVVFIHGWDAAVHRRLCRSGLLRALAAWLLNGVAVIAVLGTSFRDGLIALGVDPARIEIGRTMYEPLAELSSEAAGRPYILFLSRFDREKGGRELIAAFAALAADYPALDLIMAGSGDDREALQAIAHARGVAARVHFPGYVGGAAKSALLRGCTLFALPTYYRSEGLPVAMLEAMGAGKPILVGRAGAITAVVRDGEQGVVLSDVTAATVEAGLRRLLADDAFAAQAGARGLALAQGSYSAAAVTAQIEAFYRKATRC